MSTAGHSRSFGETGTLPFLPGEQLRFVVYWSFIPAGEAMLEILPVETRNGTDCLHFRATARTYDYLDLIYMVRDRIDGFTDSSMTRSILFRKLQEGKHKRDVVVDFNWEKREARYQTPSENRDPVPIEPGTFDPLSIFYAFRIHDLEEGTELACPVTDGKKAILGRAKVIRREKIRVGGNDYDTFLVEPEARGIGGIFEKGQKSTFQIWVTADRDRIPVRIKSGVKVGSFVAELTSWKKGDSPAPGAR